MNHQRPSRIIRAAIVSDSRGRSLDFLFSQLFDFPVEFTVYYRNGAHLRDLWETVEQIILFDHTDIVYLYGGVCDLTDKMYINGVKQYWPPANLNARINEINSVMSDIFSNFTLMYTTTKLCLIPEAGLDLIKYNAVPDPVPRHLLVIQEDIEKKLHFLQELAKSLNHSVGMITPFTLDVTHARRSGRMVPVYNRLYDGLHPSLSVKKKFAKIIMKHAYRVCTRA